MTILKTIVAILFIWIYFVLLPKTYAQQLDLAKEPKTKNENRRLAASKWYDLAFEQYYYGQFDEALASLDRLILVQPDDLRALELQARCYEGKKQPNDAIASYRRILQILPWNLPVHEKILKHESDDSNFAGIQATVEDMIKLDPVDGSYQLHLALLQLQQKNYGAAQQSINNALAFSKPSDIELLSKIDISPLTEKGWNETALKNFKNLIINQQKGWLPVYALKNRIWELYKNKNYREAIPLAGQYVDLEINLLGNDNAIIAIAYENLGDLYQKIDQVSEAEHHYREALRLREKHLPPSHPSLVMALEKLAAILRNTGKYTEAEALFREALELNLAYRNPEIPEMLRDFGHLALKGSLNSHFDKDNEIGVVPTQLRLARLLSDTRRYAEAEKIIKDSMALASVWEIGACSHEYNIIIAVQGRIDELLGRLNKEHQNDTQLVVKELKKLALETARINKKNIGMVSKGKKAVIIKTRRN